MLPNLVCDIVVTGQKGGPVNMWGHVSSAKCRRRGPVFGCAKYVSQLFTLLNTHRDINDSNTSSTPRAEGK